MPAPSSQKEPSPSAIQVVQGLDSFKTVQFQGKFLYSKYSPAKAVLRAVEQMPILPGTLVVACSPALWYGARELLARLPEDCFLLAAEFEPELYELAESELDFPLPENAAFARSPSENPDDYLPAGTFRRVLRFDLSAGAAFHAERYARLAQALQDKVSVFWKNRVTLMNMGRLFSRNLIENLGTMALQKENFLEEKKILSPILVCGAGESLNLTVPLISGSLFVIAVDAAAQVLLESGIRPDAIVTMESQLAIEKAFFCAKDSGIEVWADLCSRPNAIRIPGGNISFFSSEFTCARFLDRLKDEGLRPCVIPPLGSVGLAAVELALRARASEEVPVFVTGLDFSYTVGRTHANGPAQHYERLSKCARLFPAENYDAAFKPDAATYLGKNQIEVRSDTALCGYNASFCAYFRAEKNLFDIGRQGLPLGIAQISEKEMLFKCEKPKSKAKTERKTQQEKNGSRTKAARSWLESTKSSLEELNSLLSFGDGSEGCRAKIRRILEQNEFLFLHFADGHRLRLDADFLKRIRGQSDYFIKAIRQSLGELG